MCRRLWQSTAKRRESKETNQKETNQKEINWQKQPIGTKNRRFWLPIYGGIHKKPRPEVIPQSAFLNGYLLCFLFLRP